MIEQQAIIVELTGTPWYVWAVPGVVMPFLLYMLTRWRRKP